MLDRVTLSLPYRQRRGITALASVTALFCVIPLSLVHGQTAVHTVALKAPLKVGMIKTKSHVTRHAAVDVKRTKAVAKPPVATPVVSGSTVVYNLQYARAKQAAEQLHSIYRVSEVAIFADDRTNSVVVRGNKAITTEVGSVINSLDQPAALDAKQQAARQMRVYHLKYPRASDTAEVLRNSVATRGLASIAVDARTNSLIIVGDPSILKNVDDALRNVDTPTDEAVTRFFPLNYADARSLVALIKQIKQGHDLPVITPDPRVNSLILTGTEDQINEVARLISALDAPEKK